MSKIELIYDADCPNLKEMRTQLRHSFKEAGIPPQWQEWERGASESPSYVKKYGSPTILINGQDMEANLKLSDGSNCRLYKNEEGKLKGVPSIELITEFLMKNKKELDSAVSTNSKQSGKIRATLAILPGIGTVLLPKLFCPACWPAYAGILSSMGLGFINYTPYLLPLTVVFLLIALFAFGYKAQNRRGFGPLILGSMASLVIIIGKFIFSSDISLYGGIILLVSASLWNAWPKRKEVLCHEC